MTTCPSPSAGPGGPRRSLRCAIAPATEARPSLATGVEAQVLLATATDAEVELLRPHLAAVEPDVARKVLGLDRIRLARSPAEAAALPAFPRDWRSSALIAGIVARGWADDVALAVAQQPDDGPWASSQRLGAWSELWPHLGAAVRARLRPAVVAAVAGERLERDGIRARMLPFLERADVLAAWADDGGAAAPGGATLREAIPLMTSYLDVLGGSAALTMATRAIAAALTDAAP